MNDKLLKKYEVALENFNNIQELIRFIDQKTNFLFIILGFLITIFIEFAKIFVFKNPNYYNGIKCFLSWLILLSGALFILSVLYELYILIYKVLIVRKAKKTKSKNSLFYYENILQHTDDEFINIFIKANDNEVVESILFQVYEIAHILKKKNKYYLKAINILKWNILFLVIYTVSAGSFLSI